jgi:nucleoside-diphosphate kinase
MAIERTFIILKPDAVQRALSGEILSRFERKGLRIVGLKLIQVSKDLAETHYGEHKARPFYKGLVEFITSGPVVCIALEGPYAVSIARKLIGKTFGQEAEAGTIRGDYSSSRGLNLIHGSDSPESAARELALWFKPSELVEYSRVVEQWVSNSEDRA